jgi:hypothetical protein
MLTDSKVDASRGLMGSRPWLQLSLRRALRIAATLGAAFVFGVLGGGAACSSALLHAGSPSPAATSACTASAANVCARAMACSAPLVSYYFGSVTECENEVTDACTSAYSSPSAATAPATCDLSAVSCDQIKTLGGAAFGDSLAATLFGYCPVTPGSAPSGAACLTANDCANGTCSTNQFICGGQNGIYTQCSSDVLPSCGTCQPPLPSSSCVTNLDCPSSLVCDLGACAAYGTCPTPGRCTGQLGEPCLGAAGAPDCDLGAGLVCTSGACAPIPLSPVGGPCTATSITSLSDLTGTFCEAGGACVGGTCQPVQLEGGPCGSPEQCGRGLGCVGGACRVSVPISGCKL